VRLQVTAQPSMKQSACQSLPKRVDSFHVFTARAPAVLLRALPTYPMLRAGAFPQLIASLKWLMSRRGV
jgi:hypothetical protein